jgi:hypothetical protein
MADKLKDKYKTEEVAWKKEIIPEEQSETEVTLGEQPEETAPNYLESIVNILKKLSKEEKPRVIKPLSIRM